MKIWICFLGAHGVVIGWGLAHLGLAGHEIAGLVWPATAYDVEPRAVHRVLQVVVMIGLGSRDCVVWLRSQRDV